MPRPIPDKAYMNFSGGLRLDIAPISLPDNCVQKAVNVDFDELGRIKKREGYKCFGSTTTYTPGKATFFYKEGNGSYNNILAEQGNASSNIYKMIRSPLNGALTTASTSVVVDSGTDFTSSGTAEVNGDVFAYTGKSTNILTGVTGLSTSHATDSPVRQWSSVDAFDGRYSVSFAILNEYIFISGRPGTNTMKKYDNASATDNTDYGLVTNYRTKLFGVSLADQIFFSNAGDGTTWTATDNFYITKGYGRHLVAQQVVGNYLGIWTENEFWTHDNYYTRQRLNSTGAYNDKVVREVNNVTYFFGSKGICYTNGITVSPPISAPIKPYLDDFTPTYNIAATPEICMNTAAGRYGNKYILHIGDTTTKHTITNANLIYDTVLKNWTVWSGLDADGMCFDYVAKQASCSSGANALVNTSVYLFGGAGNQVYEFGGVYHDNWSDISVEVEFKPFHLDLPQRKKHFGELKVFSENAGFNLFYKIDDEVKWHPLGLVQEKIKKLRINKKGYKITLKLTESSQKKPFVLNGFVFEKCYAITD